MLIIKLQPLVLRLTVIASDARSGNTIEDRIRPALEAGSAIGETRPVLVVIDEIDGATGGTDNVRRRKKASKLWLTGVFTDSWIRPKAH